MENEQKAAWVTPEVVVEEEIEVSNGNNVGGLDAGIYDYDGSPI